MAKQIRGTATLSGKTRRRAIRKKPLGFWPVTIGVAVIAGTSDPHPPEEKVPPLPPPTPVVVATDTTTEEDSPKVVWLSPADGEVLDRSSVDTAGRIESDTDQSGSVTIEAAGRKFDIAITENSFNARFTDLAPGWTEFRARVETDDAQFETIKVLAPRVNYHFDESNSDWTASSTSPNLTLRHTIENPYANGFLTATAAEHPLDIIFVVDTTNSMLAVYDSVVASADGMIEALQRNVPGIRFGVVSFHDSRKLAPGEPGNIAEVVRRLKPGAFKLSEVLPETIFTGGGDAREDQYQGIREAIRQFEIAKPSENTQRLMVVLSDAPPVEDNKFLSELERQDVTIFPVVAHFNRPLPGPVYELLKPIIDRELFRGLEVVGAWASTQEEAEKIEVDFAKLTLAEIRKHEENYQVALTAARKIASTTGGESFTVKNGFLIETPDVQSVVDGVVNAVNQVVQATDPTANSRCQITWVAPQRCVKNLQAAAGDTLVFSTQNLAAIKLVLVAEDQTKLSCSIDSISDPPWQRHRVELAEREKWTIENRSEVQNLDDPSAMKQVLESLQSLHILGEPLDRQKPVAFDRFIVTPPSTNVIE